MSLSRRELIRLAALGGLVACSDSSTTSAEPATVPSSPANSAAVPATTSTIPTPRLDGPPFALGVASGDPLPDAVVLWTRLVTDPTVVGGGTPEVDIPVRWEVAADERFASIVAGGEMVATPDAAHSVHVDVSGLEPARSYAYRFSVGPHDSPVGRTRTAPAPSQSPPLLRFAVASCHAYQSGYFTAYRFVAEEDLDAVLFTGDYIYELEASRSARQHDIGVPTTLEQYRQLYAITHADADLRVAHAAHPWIVTWDDHEVEDNYAADRPGAVGVATGLSDPATFPERRTAAYRAWWEHMPVRAGPPDRNGALPIHRELQFGRSARLVVLDNRQYRTPIPSGEGAGNLPRGFGGGAQLPAALDEDATILGREQERWAAGRLAAADVRWSVLVHQTALAELDRAPGDDRTGFSMDGWDGYVASRRRLLEPAATAGRGNVISLAGDLHTSVVADVRADYEDPTSPLVASEFVGPSISALEIIAPEAVAGVLTNDHVKLYDPDHRGYLVAEIEPDRVTARFRFVDALDPSIPAPTDGGTWRVRHGIPGAVPTE